MQNESKENKKKIQQAVAKKKEEQTWEKKLWAVIGGLVLLVAVLGAAVLQDNLEFLPTFVYEPPPTITSTIVRDLIEENKTVWCPFDSNAVDVLLERSGWTSVRSERDATLIWVRDEEDVDSKRLALGHGQILNAIRGTEILTNKANLHRLLKDINQTALQPETYILGSSDIDSCTAFFRAAAADPTAVWVTKEPDSAMGEGIVIKPDVSKLAKEYLIDPNTAPEERRCKPVVSDQEELVVQRYIRNPLLLTGKKMEIRTYWLIVSLKPLIVLYHDGTVRLTTRDYKDDNWEDPLIHITNTRQQKNADPKFWDTVADRKWSLPQLGEYLEKEGKVKNAELWLSQELRPYLKNVIAMVAKAAYPSLVNRQTRQPPDAGRFELMGMDIILDSNLHPWLTEVQCGPGLSRDPGIKFELITNLIEEMFSIALEVDISKRYGLPLSAKTLKNTKQWQVVDIE